MTEPKALALLQAALDIEREIHNAGAALLRAAYEGDPCFRRMVDRTVAECKAIFAEMPAQEGDR